MKTKIKIKQTITLSVEMHRHFSLRARIWRRVEIGSSPYQDVYYSVTITQHYKV